MVVFSKSVLRQTNVEVANTFSRWMRTTYLFSLMSAFLSDSYMGRYLTCHIPALSFSTHRFLLKPHGCGTIGVLCEPHAPIEVAMFYLSIYLIALGSGSPEPALATFGADQFDEEDPMENRSKKTFYSYFYVAINLGSLIAETVLVYAENIGYWVLGFWICVACAVVAYVLLLSGSFKYRHFKPSGNPISRFCQVMVASFRKMKLEGHPNGEGLYEIAGNEGEINGTRKILHTDDFKFPDRATIITAMDMQDQSKLPNPWRLCAISQVEEIPQYILLGTSEAFVYIAQMQSPDALKSSGVSLSMSSTAIVSYIYSMILTVVMAITSRNGKPVWVPPSLSHGHLERYFFMSAALAALNLGRFVIVHII
ncbi:Nitrate/chlorate transporter, putative [Ricinus communis]|uniref:Nitrate/chlorate transporter, putative n=1 Tax=Ricinus communis TaxID=3988 RepID=B9RD98_RICCO|nr:Nitrate/chlorate transporter, putative [Ricinus communis]